MRLDDDDGGVFVATGIQTMAGVMSPLHLKRHNCSLTLLISYSITFGCEETVHFAIKEVLAFWSALSGRGACGGAVPAAAVMVKGEQQQQEEEEEKEEGEGEEEGHSGSGRHGELFSPPHTIATTPLQWHPGLVLRAAVRPSGDTAYPRASCCFDKNSRVPLSVIVAK
ncbi:hypothetical protein E2C01_049360 [Portunus trituberculatus]|uniref:Uncharacterized protein n=1 Tax=Portunus trituberculatus TaxID=210409 RepID=A0A5B7GDH6_PORTR|nr:hypothetical protein [Portunus trituberculatus]